MISPAFAQQAGAPAGDMSFLIIMVGMLAIFYFLLWRPQRKRQKEHEEMIKNLRRGDRVVTAGGLVGTVVKATEDDEVDVEIASGVKVRVVRALVSQVRAKTEPVKAEKAEKPEKGGKKKKKGEADDTPADETKAEDAKADETKADESPVEEATSESTADEAPKADSATDGTSTDDKKS